MIIQIKKLRLNLMKKEKINQILACPECTIMNNCYLRLRSTFSSLALEFGYKKALGASYEQNSFDRRLILVIFVEKLL